MWKEKLERISTEKMILLLSLELEVLVEIIALQLHVIDLNVRSNFNHSAQEKFSVFGAISMIAVLLLKMEALAKQKIILRSTQVI